MAVGLLAVGPIALAATVPACSKRDKPDLAGAKTWSKYGFGFEYPGKWRLGDELDRGDGMEIVTVTVETGSTWKSSLVMLQTFEPALPATFEMLAKQYLGELPDALAESGMEGVEVVDQGPVEYPILGAERTGRRVHLRGTVDGEARDIVTELHVIELANRTVVLQTQAPVTELEAASAAFTMIRTTLAQVP